MKKYISKELFYANTVHYLTTTSSTGRSVEMRRVIVMFEGLCPGTILNMDSDKAAVFYSTGSDGEYTIFHFVNKSENFINLYDKLNEEN